MRASVRERRCFAGGRLLAVRRPSLDRFRGQWCARHGIGPLEPVTARPARPVEARPCGGSWAGGLVLGGADFSRPAWRGPCGLRCRAGGLTCQGPGRRCGWQQAGLAGACVGEPCPVHLGRASASCRGGGHARLGVGLSALGRWLPPLVGSVWVAWAVFTCVSGRGVFGLWPVGVSPRLSFSSPRALLVACGRGLTMPKGVGNKKGKQSAKKAAKRPASVPPSTPAESELARAAFSGQGEPSSGSSGGGSDPGGSSSSTKLKEVVHSLPWGASCGATTGSGGSESPLPSGDITMPLGDHLLQATREKILRG